MAGVEAEQEAARVESEQTEHAVCAESACRPPRAQAARVAGVEAEQEAARVESEQTERAVCAESMRAARFMLESEQARRALRPSRPSQKRCAWSPSRPSKRCVRSPCARRAWCWSPSRRARTV